MGDFFYYGQKDTIRQLNELVGRGAVVASYAPAVGRSPLGGTNGKITPDWLDTAIPFKFYRPVSVGNTAKYGYEFASTAGQRNWYHIATFSQDDAGNQENLLIRGTLNDGWLASQTSTVTILMGVRNGFYVDWHIEGRLRGNARIIVYRNPDLTHSVYAFLDGFANATFDLTGRNVATYPTPIVTGHPGPAGAVVFDTSASPNDPPYIAPRWGAPWNPGSKGLQVDEILSVGDGSITTSFLVTGAKQNALAPGAIREILRLGVGGIDSLAHPGCFGLLTAAGDGSLNKEGYRLSLKAYDMGSNLWSGDLLNIKGNGAVYVPLLKAGSSDPSTLRHNISRGTTEGEEILYVGRDGVAASVAILSAGLYDWGQALSVMYVGKNSTTNSSMRTGGTVSTSGNDYAEYIFKCLMCGIISPGQIIGITASNKITDKWADAVMFSIKSTAPSFVGGDTWASDLGPRPSPKAGAAPTQPKRRADVVTRQPVPGTNPPEFEDVVTEPGDTDSEWAEKQAAYTAALATHNIAVQQDADAMAAFDAALEVERQKVDRIAIAGRVPVNVMNAQPGDYIVPVQDGAGIKGIAVHEDDINMKQYLRAVGRVISIEPDGRAYVMVKVV